ncbi:hypothetical protein [Evansella clarkii]|nr:hypothetical protein [Evansella clarkii]
MIVQEFRFQGEVDRLEEHTGEEIEDIKVLLDTYKRGWIQIIIRIDLL